MKKYILGAVLSLGILASPAFTQAAALTDAQINSILALLSSFGADSKVVWQVKAALTGNTIVEPQDQKSCHTFNRNIKIGDSGTEVAALHSALFREGISDNATGDYFDEPAAKDVSSFQEKYADEILTPNGLVQGTGFVGKATRAKLNQLYGCDISDEKNGTLRISLQNQVVGVGRTIEAEATYTPWSAPCPPNIGCSPPPSESVAVSWSTDRSDILGIAWDKGPLAKKAYLKGLTYGTAYVKALYTFSSGKGISTDAKVEVIQGMISP